MLLNSAMIKRRQGDIGRYKKIVKVEVEQSIGEI